MKTKFFLLSMLAIFLCSSNVTSQEKKQVDENRNKGYFNITKFGYKFVSRASLETFNPILGNSKFDLPTNEASVFSLQTINGYFINSYVSLGVGFGLDGYHNPNANTIPLFADIRLYAKDSKKSGYLFANAGTLVQIENGRRRGGMINIGLGYKYPINNKRFILITDLGFSYKNISLDDQPFRDSNDQLRIYGMMLSIGVLF